MSLGRQMRQFSTTQTHKNASVSSGDAFCSFMCIHLLLPAPKDSKTSSNRLPKEARKLIYKVKQAHFCLLFACDSSLCVSHRSVSCDFLGLHCLCFFGCLEELLLSGGGETSYEQTEPYNPMKKFYY